MSKGNIRPKASDIFSESNYVFAKKVGFDEAFPEIEDVTVEVEETGDGVYGKGSLAYRKPHVGEFIDCSNPLCYNGGISIGSFLREMIRNRQTELETSKMCQGYEGSPKGRRVYRRCFNFFKIKVSVKYKENQSDTSKS